MAATDPPRLFPHERSRLLAEPTVQVVLDAVIQRGGTYKAMSSGGLWITGTCPSCRRGKLWIAADGSKVRLTCISGGCSREAILDSLAGVVS
jgi:hypothetical protein